MPARTNARPADASSGTALAPLQYAPDRDVGLALGVVMLLSVLVLPLPPMLLDFGLALSITAAVLVLMVALFLDRPLDFTSFPTLLLLTTLLRLVAERRHDAAHPVARRRRPRRRRPRRAGVRRLPDGRRRRHRRDRLLPSCWW